MYIRSKVVKHSTYYQVVESRRVDGKVRQFVLCSLGRDPDPKKHLRWMRVSLARQRKGLAAMIACYPPGRGEMSAGETRGCERLRARCRALERDIEVLVRYIREHPVVGTTGA